MCDGLHIDPVTSCIVIDGNVRIGSNETQSRWIWPGHFRTGDGKLALQYLNRATLVRDTLGDLMAVGVLLHHFCAWQAMKNGACAPCMRQSTSPRSSTHSVSKFLQWQDGGKVWNLRVILVAAIAGLMCPQVARRCRRKKQYHAPALSCSEPSSYSGSEGISRNCSTTSSALKKLAPEGGPLCAGKLDSEDQDNFLQWTPNENSSAGVASQPEWTQCRVPVKTPPQYQHSCIRNLLLPEETGCEDTDALVSSKQQQQQQQQQKQKQQVPPLQQWQLLEQQPDMHDPTNVSPNDHISDESDSDLPAPHGLERRWTMPCGATGRPGFVQHRAKALNILKSPPVFPLLPKRSNSCASLMQDEPPRIVSMAKGTSNASRPGFVRRRSKELETNASAEQSGSP